VVTSGARDVRLRIPSFTAPSTAPSGDDGKDLIFLLQCDRINKDISDGVIAIALPDWRGGAIAPLLIVKEQITLVGAVYERQHTVGSHPVSSAVEHDPDMIDLEEAVVTWSGSAPVQLVHLETDFNGSAWRTYQGVILQCTLNREAARTKVDFKLVFGVLFEPSARPGLREWS
jgi:hypothetical protein